MSRSATAMEVLLSPERRSPLVFGHRGYSSHAPENTLASFALIRERSVEGVELDVHRCGSGELVVIHDNDLRRVAGSSLNVTETPFGRLRELEVGSWFSKEFAGERIPTLSEVFELLGDSVVYDIEIKYHGAGLKRAAPESVEALLAATIARHGLKRRCFVSSFDPLSMMHFHHMEPEVPTAVIYVDSPEMPLPLRHGLGRIVAGASIMKPHFAQASGSLVRKQLRAGRAVVPWTVDDRAAAERLASLGVAGIITNDPGSIREAVENR